jgi:hypothetical protein
VAPIAAWASRLFRYAGEAAWAAYELQFEAVHELPTEDISWTRVEFHFTRNTPSGTTEDRAITKLDLASMDDAPLAASLSSGERTTAGGILTTLFATIMASSSNTHKLVERRWYDMRFRTPMTPQERFADRGAPVQIDPLSVSGSLSTSGEVPYQSAMSITFKTAARRHWGRMYLPGLDSGNLDTNGRIASALTVSFANAFETAIEALAADGTLVVVPSTQVDGVLTGALLLPHTLQIDDIPDVIRRRRAKSAAIRTTRP